VVVIAVSDVDRAKEFYGKLGWRLDADYDSGKDFVIQFTPPGSGCSIIFGENVTSVCASQPMSTPHTAPSTSRPRATSPPTLPNAASPAPHSKNR
jgi:catechol 2,3-dioxygenase-like lactoylglutathione lyase family enzyme